MISTNWSAHRRSALLLLICCAARTLLATSTRPCSTPAAATCSGESSNITTLEGKRLGTPSYGLDSLAAHYSRLHLRHARVAAGRILARCRALSHHLRPLSATSWLDGILMRS